jgi:ABC-2 type transport system permease protein
MDTPWFGFSFGAVIIILLAFDALILLAIQPLLRRRFA